MRCETLFKELAASAEVAEREYLAVVDRMVVLEIEKFIRQSVAADEKFQKWLIDNPNYVWEEP